MIRQETWIAYMFIAAFLASGESHVRRRRNREHKNQFLSQSYRKSLEVHIDRPRHHGHAEYAWDEKLRREQSLDSTSDIDDLIVTVSIGIQKIPEGENHDDIRDRTIASIAEQLATNCKEISIDYATEAITRGYIDIPRSMISLLDSLPEVRYAEEDNLISIHEDVVYAQGETIPGSIDLANGDTYPGFPYPRSATNNCSSADAIRIAVVDGGLDCGHWDFEFCGVNPVTGEAIEGQEVRCMGKQFLPPGAQFVGQDWCNSRRSHGVHVAGLVAASGVNGVGVAGMLPDKDFCLMIVRVFADNGAASMIKLKEGIDWAVENGAKVINMSLGTYSNSSTLRDAIDNARKNDVLLVGSAGNRNTNSHNYPAAYEDVLGVASVDANNNKAWFSNYGDYIDIAAAGVSVLSTMPRIDEQPETVIEVMESSDITAATLSGELIIYSSYIGLVGVEGALIDCGYGDSICPGNGGHVCLIQQSGGGPAYMEAQNCVDSNGAGVILYDYVNGTLGVDAELTPQWVPIPVIGVSNETGSVLQNFEGKTVQLYNLIEDASGTTVGYGRKHGTSMSAPLVAGAAAYLWRQCPDCSSDNVTHCLLSTAKDPANGNNIDHYGNGILQTDLAFHCMVDLSCCPYDFSESPSISPSDVPSALPSESVSPTNSVKPSHKPSRFPSWAPSGAPTIVPSLTPSSRPS